MNAFQRTQRGHVAMWRTNTSLPEKRFYVLNPDLCMDYMSLLMESLAAIQAKPYSIPMEEF